MRLLAGEYKKPFVDDVITLGAALKLTPQQLFGEENMVVESASTVSDIADLKRENEDLKRVNERLKNEIAHKKEVIALKDELHGLYRETRKPNVFVLSTL